MVEVEKKRWKTRKIERFAESYTFLEILACLKCSMQIIELCCDNKWYTEEKNTSSYTNTGGNIDVKFGQRGEAILFWNNFIWWK